MAVGSAGSGVFGQVDVFSDQHWDQRARFSHASHVFLVERGGRSARTVGVERAEVVVGQVISEAIRGAVVRAVAVGSEAQVDR